MAIRSSCCLNLPPKPASSSPSFPPPKPSQLPCTIKKEEESAKNRIRGVAGLIIGLEMVSLVMIGSSNESNGQYYSTNAKQVQLVQVVEPISNYVQLAKWSDRIRMCPPWHLNSLESIVPENLPRPSPRRRLEAAGRHAQKNAPALNSNSNRVSFRGIDDCFSM